MADTVSKGQHPFEVWNKQLEQIMNTYQTSPMSEGQVPQGEKDPWTALLAQMWQMNPVSKLLPLDPVETTKAFQQMWLQAVTNPARAWTEYSDFVQQYTQMMASVTLKAWGKNADPVAAPAKGDKRFSATDWQQNPVFDAIKQSYLLTATTLLKSASEVEGLDEKQQQKLMFYLRQFLDAISPTNAFFTNPQVIHETIQSGGQNLVKGMEHLMRDIKNGQIKMTDTDAFDAWT